jgi:hypothetical protein
MLLLCSSGSDSCVRVDVRLVTMVTIVVISVVVVLVMAAVVVCVQ